MSGVRWTLWLPLALFTVFFVLVIHGLTRPGSTEIESAMIGKPLPSFTLEPAVAERPGLASSDFAAGAPRLLNVFASWCAPCEQEIPMLMQLKAQGVEIVGVAVHDASPQLQQFLARNGNPYGRIGLDEAGRVQIALGSAGVPETFVVDGTGRITYQHIGVIKPEDLSTVRSLLRNSR